MRAVILRMAVKISLQRASCGVRLVDYPDTRRQGRGEEIGDERVMGAAENYALGYGADFPQQLTNISVNERAQIAARESTLDGAGKVGTGLLRDRNIRSAFTDLDRVAISLHGAAGRQNG